MRQVNTNFGSWDTCLCPLYDALQLFTHPFKVWMHTLTIIDNKKGLRLNVSAREPVLTDSVALLHTSLLTLRPKG